MKNPSCDTLDKMLHIWRSHRRLHLREEVRDTWRGIHNLRGAAPSVITTDGRRYYPGTTGDS